MKYTYQTKSQNKGILFKNSILSMITMLIVMLLSQSSNAQREKATIYGKIISQSTEKLIPFAEITILKNSKSLGTITTDINGIYNANLQPGIYDFEASLTGYKVTSRQNTMVKDGDSLKINFILKEKGNYTSGSSSISDLTNDNPSDELLNIEASNINYNIAAEPHIKAIKINLKTKEALVKKAKPKISSAKYDVYRNKEAKSPFRYPVAKIPMVFKNKSLEKLKHSIAQGILEEKENALIIQDLINSYDYKYQSPTSKSKPFDIYTELYPCPWNEEKRLLHIGIQTIKPDSIAQLNDIYKITAEDVSMSVEFNPAYVSEYRLIGYEDYFPNLLSYQKDPSMEATMHEGQNLTAIYEFTPTQNKYAVETVKLMYQNRSKTLEDNNELGGIKITYRSPTARKRWTISKRVNRFVKSMDDIDEKTVLAVSIAEIAMKIRGSHHLKQGLTNDIIRRIRNVENLSTEGQEILEMIERIQKIEAHK